MSVLGDCDLLKASSVCVLLCVNANYLHPQDAKHYEEGAADKDNVPDGSEGGDERLHNQLQSWGSADHPGNTNKDIQQHKYKR